MGHFLYLYTLFLAVFPFTFRLTVYLWRLCYSCAKCSIHDVASLFAQKTWVFRTRACTGVSCLRTCWATARRTTWPHSSATRRARFVYCRPNLWGQLLMCFMWGCCDSLYFVPWRKHGIQPHLKQNQVDKTGSYKSWYQRWNIARVSQLWLTRGRTGRNGLRNETRHFLHYRTMDDDRYDLKERET